jgi:hypothetical protein
MRFHGIEMVGPLLLESIDTGVDTATEMRIGYDTNSVYFANGSSWIKLLDESTGIPSGTEIWIHANTAPAGWTITAYAGDTLLAVKGGTGNYNHTAGTGTAYGTWNGLDHNHTSGTLTSGNHYHKWYTYTSGDGYTYNSDGTTALFFSSTHGTKSTNGLMSLVSSADSWRWSADSYTTTQSGSTSLSGNTGSTTTYTTGTRPYAHLGIICSKN